MEEITVTTNIGYITLDDEENQLTRCVNSYETFHSISLDEDENPTNTKCIICFNTDISLAECYSCKTCAECLICKTCIRPTLLRKVNTDLNSISLKATISINFKKAVQYKLKDFSSKEVFITNEISAFFKPQSI